MALIAAKAENGNSSLVRKLWVAVVPRTWNMIGQRGQKITEVDFICQTMI